METVRNILIAASLVAITATAHAESTCSVPDLAPRDGAWLLFGSFRGGNYASSTHAIRSDGTGECQVSRHPRGQPGSLDASLSPDGSQIVFARGGDGSHRTSLWIEVNGEERRLLENMMVRFRNGRIWPSFSPDGTTILFVREADGVRSIQLLTVDGGHIEVLGPGEYPAWSPDGEWIAFEVVAGDDSHVFTMKADGSQRRQLTDGSPCGYAAWSPDGSKIVYCREVGETIDLFVMNRDGTNPTAIVSTTDRSERHPAWSPDGKYIAFVAVPDDSPDGWQRSVYVIPVGGGTARQVTSSKYNDTRPLWINTP